MNTESLECILPEIHKLLSHKINHIDIENGLSQPKDHPLFLTASIAFLQKYVANQLKVYKESAKEKNELITQIENTFSNELIKITGNNNSSIHNKNKVNEISNNNNNIIINDTNSNENNSKKQKKKKKSLFNFFKSSSSAENKKQETPIITPNPPTPQLSNKSSNIFTLASPTSTTPLLNISERKEDNIMLCFSMPTKQETIELNNVSKPVREETEKAEEETKVTEQDSKILRYELGTYDEHSESRVILVEFVSKSRKNLKRQASSKLSVCLEEDGQESDANDE